MNSLIFIFRIHFSSSGLHLIGMTGRAFVSSTNFPLCSGFSWQLYAPMTDPPSHWCCHSATSLVRSASDLRFLRSPVRLRQQSLRRGLSRSRGLLTAARSAKKRSSMIPLCMKELQRGNAKQSRMLMFPLAFSLQWPCLQNRLMLSRALRLVSLLRWQRGVGTRSIVPSFYVPGLGVRDWNGQVTRDTSVARKVAVRP